MPPTVIKRNRFTLREESFGGLLFDSKHRTYYKISPDAVLLFDAALTGGNGERFKHEIEKNGFAAPFAAFLKRNDVIRRTDELLDCRMVKHPVIDPRKRDLAAPVRVYDYIGYGCSLACRRCLNDSSKRKLELDRRSVSRTKEVMAKFYDAGILEWQFTGGEPTLYPEFPELVGIAKEYNFWVLLNTNGCWENHGAILDSGINEVMISIEGGRAANDELRGEGVYDRVVHTIELIHERNQGSPDRKIFLTLNMTYGKSNIGELDHVVRLGIRYNANVSLLPERPYGRANHNTLLSKLENLEFLKRAAEWKKRPEYLRSGIKISNIMDLFNQNYFAFPGGEYACFIDYTTCGPYSNSLSLLPNGDANICGFFYDHQAFTGPNLTRETVSVYDSWLDPGIRQLKDARRVECEQCPFYRKQCLGKCAAIVLADGGGVEDDRLIGEDRYCYAREIAGDGTPLPSGGLL